MQSFFRLHGETKHIKLTMFTVKIRIRKKRLYQEFGYKYDRNVKGDILGTTSEKRAD